MDGARNEEKLNLVIKDYLKRKSCYTDGPWIIKKSPLGGFGVFAKRNIEPGEIIFVDIAVILGPRYLPKNPLQCSVCYSKNNLKHCDKNCSLTVCDCCLTSEQHLKECQLIKKFKNNREFTDEEKEQLGKCLTPLRSLTLSKEDFEVVTILKSHRGSQHGREVDILTEKVGLKISEEERNVLYFVCTVLDANAFEVLTDGNDNTNTVRGLFPLGSLTNHRCFPNVFHVFDEKRRMVVRAAVFIEKDSEIFNSYTRLLWGTITRTFHLRNTKHFVCKCERCLDPTECGTYMSATCCKKCKGNLLPKNPIRPSNWQCETCGSVEQPKTVAKTLSLVGSVLKGFDNDDFKIMLNFLKRTLTTLMPESNQVAVELKYKIVWILGHKQGFLWNEMSLDLLLLKKQFCEDILEILEKLQCGKCKIRGLLLYELYLFNEEMKSRENNNESDFQDKSNTYLNEAADILKYDASAPDMIKQEIGQTNGH